jgi:hypothetical protein
MDCGVFWPVRVAAEGGGQEHSSITEIRMDAEYPLVGEQELQERLQAISLWEWNSFLLRLRIALRKFNLDSFVSVYYDFRVAVAFDWYEWEEGLKFMNSDFPDFSDKDLMFCLKTFTALIRKNRIEEGYLEMRILDGFVSHLIARLDDLINNPEEDHFDYEDMMDELFNHGKKWEYRNLKTVLDMDSSEFFDTNWRNKKSILKRVLSETNFMAVIQQYKKDYLDAGSAGEINALEKTLLHYVRALLAMEDQLYPERDRPSQ